MGQGHYEIGIMSLLMKLACCSTFPPIRLLWGPPGISKLHTDKRVPSSFATTTIHWTVTDYWCDVLLTIHRRIACDRFLLQPQWHVVFGGSLHDLALSCSRQAKRICSGLKKKKKYIYIYKVGRILRLIFNFSSHTNLVPNAAPQSELFQARQKNKKQNKENS